jgi:hypothetical protein
MKDFVPYNESLEVKELGFDEDCFARYEGKITQIMKPLVIGFTFANLPRVENKVGYPNYPYPDVEAPTFSQAFRFFREKYGLHGTPLPTSFEILDKNNDLVEWGCIIEQYPLNSYEEAELACLQKLIQIVKDEKLTHTTNR